jgi:photosystem II stability/assembly factor-like uncharacterized protein
LTAQKPPDSISLMVSKMKFQPANVVNTALSEAVAQAITHAMEPQTEARPQSVVAWKQELQHAQAGVPLLVVAEAEDEDEQETMLPGTVMAPGGIAANFADFDLLAEEEETPYWLIDTQKLGYQVGAEPLVIGRHSEADIIVRDKSISRRHTMVKVEEGQCVVRDNDSANGTFLNGERLDSGWQPLKAGDVLTIGSAQFTLSSTPPATLAPPKSTAAPIITSQDEVATSFDPVQQERAKVDPAPTPPPIAVWDTPAPAPPAQSLPDSKPVAVWDLPASSPTTPPPVIPAATQKNNMPLIIGAVVLLAVLGAVAFFLFSGDDTPTTPPTEPEVAEASEQNGGQNETIVGVTETETAEAVVSEELAATAESEATQAAEETATAAATGEAATAEAAEEVITEPEPATEEPIAEEPTPEAPTSIPTEASTATPEPDTPTPPPTVTNPPAQSSPPTNTPAPVVSGPTAIPLQSEESLQQIGGREVIDVDINPRNANEVYVLVKADGVYKSSTGGIPPWAKMPINGSGMTAFTIDPANSARFYGPSWNAVLKTEDGGNTWKAYGEGLSTANRSVDLVTVDPVNPNLLYGGIGATLVVSTDGGTTWISDGYGTGLGEGKLTSIVIDPFNNNTVFVGGEFGSLYRSVDSGRNFLQLAFNTGRGVYGMAAHPTQKDVYLVGLNSYDAGIMKTENGADFISSSNGLVFGGADSAYSAIVYAPSNPNIVYAGSGYESDADAKGIFKSTDGGKSWNRISDGLSTNPTTGQPHYVKAIAVHPTNPNTVFAATGGGLYQTTNGGDTWVLK